MSLRKELLCKIACAGVLTAFGGLCFADGDAQKSVDLHGFVSMEGGQFVRYKYKSQDYLHKWLQKNILGFAINASARSRVDFFVTAGGVMYYNTIFSKVIAFPDDFVNKPQSEFFLDRAEIALHCSPDPKDSLLDIGIGLWDEKYNSDARNLGEYLFRSGAYPGYIYNQFGFDNPYARVAGIHIDNNLFGFWHNQLLLTSELYLVPYNDFSLAYVTDVSNAQKTFTFGGGIQFFRCFSVDPGQTTPKRAYKGGVDMGVAPTFYLDSIGVDTIGMPVYDTSWYSYAGTKLMARFMFDPKPLLGLNIFGAEDLRFYAEAAILGLKNYPNSILSNGAVINRFGFDKLMEKMPIMFGINFPAFNLLDLLSMEFEYYGKKYVNQIPIPMGTKGEGSYWPTTSNPYNPTGTPSIYDSLYQKSGAAHWKWSVYVKKTLFNHFSITAQAARDHIINTVNGLSAIEVDREEALVRQNQWYWMLKFSASF